MSPAKVQRFDENVTRVLRDLRDAAKLTQVKAAKYFEVNRGAFADWEMGYSKPHLNQRSLFIGYLFNKLRLSKNHEQFLTVWRDVMKKLWGWNSLSTDELDELGIAYKRTLELPKLFSASARVPPILIGRDKILGNLKTWLLGHNVVALVGLPGVGKTALAASIIYDEQMQSHFHDIMWWIRLGKNANLLAELTRLGSALNVELPKVRHGDEIRMWVHAIQTAIGNRRALIIIDDAWSLEDAMVFQFGGANCSYLLTTRRPEIAAEFAENNVLIIKELDVEEGVELVTQLAPKLPQILHAQLKELVSAMGGLPLALILIAGQLRIRIVQSTKTELIEGFMYDLAKPSSRLAIAKSQAVIDEHPSLAPGTAISISALINVAVESLQQPALRMLSSLGTFPAKPNTFSQDAACAVSEQDETYLAHLYSIGLIEEISEHRYSVHNVIHDYINLYLPASPLFARMVNYFCEFVEQNDKHYEKLELEMMNWLAAFTKAPELNMHSFTVRGATQLYSFFANRGYYSLGIGLFDQAIAAAHATHDDLAQAKLLLHKGRTFANEGDYVQAQTSLEQGLKIAQQLDDAELVSFFYHNLGSLADNRGQYDESLRLYDTALDLLERTDLSGRKAALYTNKAIVLANQGSLSPAETTFQTALSFARQARNEELIARILLNLGVIADIRGASNLSLPLYQESLSIAQNLGLKEIMSIVLMNLASGSLERGEMVTAKDYSRQGLELARQMGNRQRIIGNLRNLGQIAVLENQYTIAEQYFSEALSLAQSMGHRERIGEVLVDLGALATATERYPLSKTQLLQAKEIAQELQHPLLLCMADYELGELNFIQSDTASARSAFQSVVENSTSNDFKEMLARGLYGLARVAYQDGNQQEAIHYGQTSHQIYVSLHHIYAGKVAAWLERLPLST